MSPADPVVPGANPAAPLPSVPTAAPLPPAVPVIPEISIDDFAKLDLRVATILEATAHPKADRLVILKIDTGLDRRQIVAGIRAHYSPEQLVGRQIIVVANLKPVKLRGEESRGMLLAAKNDTGDLCLLMPEKPINPGSKVS